MATVVHEIDETPTAIAGLSDDTEYTAENASSQRILLVEAAAQPDAQAYGHSLRGGERLSIEKRSGESLWAWCPGGGVAHLVVSEAVG